MMRALSCLAIVGSLWIAGCESPPPAPTKGSAKPTAQPSGTTAAAPSGSGADTKPSKAEPDKEAELSDDDVPVAEDFVEEATKDVTKDNYKAKTADLEKEIDAQ